ncbi:MAG: hypothetical protein RR085_11925, partial [Clostridia bacterium]
KWLIFGGASMPILMPFLSRPAAVKVLSAARELLANVTPLKSNCGKLCGGACCQADESGENGMLLFPFEETFYAKPIEGFAYRLADDDSLVRGGKRLVCEGSCPREHRPLACRLFPLRVRIQTDALGEQAKAVAELDPRAWCCCPLLENGGLRAMSGEFISAVQRAGEMMMENTALLEALYQEQRLLDEMRTF